MFAWLKDSPEEIYNFFVGRMFMVTQYSWAFLNAVRMGVSPRQGGCQTNTLSFHAPGSSGDYQQQTTFFQKLEN